MTVANKDNDFERRARSIDRNMVEIFAKSSKFLAISLAALAVKEGLSSGPEMLKAYNNYGAFQDSTLLVPAAMIFVAYGLLKEAGSRFKDSATVKADAAANGSSTREFKHKLKIKQLEDMGLSKGRAAFNASFKELFNTMDIPCIQNESLSVKEIRNEMRKAWHLLDNRTSSELVSNLIIGPSSLVTKPIISTLKLIKHSGFLSKKLNTKISGLSQRTQYAFNPENLYANQREASLIKTGSAASDLHVSPYHKYSLGEIDMLHLAALLGADKSPTAEKIKSMESMKDPRIQAVFKDSKDLLSALKGNMQSLRKSFKLLYSSLGESSQYLLSKPNDFTASLSEWSSITADVYTYAIKTSADMNLRQLGVETITELASKLQHGGLEKKDVKKIIDNLDVISKMKMRDSGALSVKNEGPFFEIGTHAGIIASSLKEAYQTSGAWPLSGLSLPKKQAGLIDTPVNKTPTKDDYINIHKLTSSKNNPFPSKTIIQELAIDKLMELCHKKIKNNILANSPPINKDGMDNKSIIKKENAQSNKAEKKADSLLSDWQQQAAVSLSREVKVETLSPSPEDENIFRRIVKM